MNNCPECQEPFDEGKKFCQKCGCNLEVNFLLKPICPKCKKNFADGTKFCDEDGSLLTTADKLIPKCVNCGEEYPADTQFCPNDGGKVLPEVEHQKTSTMKFDIGEKIDPSQFNKLIEKGYEVNISKYFRFGWDTFKKDVGGFLGFTVLFFLLNLILGIIPILGTIVSMGISAPMAAGYYIVAFKLSKNRPTEFSDFLKGFNYFLPLFLAGLVSGLFMMIGLIFLIIPGVYLAVGYLFTTLLILDKKMEFFQAMETSRKIVTRNWFSIFGFCLVLLIIGILGMIPFFLGLLITIPVSICAIASAYDDIIGIESLDY